MTLEEQVQIANTFSDKFQEFDLDLTLKAEEFKLFDDGIFAKDMDEKWNIFVLDDFMYWIRSWTGYCIYRIQLIRKEDNVMLQKGFVTREKNQYNSINLERDKILFLELLQIILERDDIYVDPAYQLNLIKQILDKHQPLINFKRSIGRQSVRINKIIYESLRHFGEDYVFKTGWTDFHEKIKSMDDDEDILSLYLQNKVTNKEITYHFDKDGKNLLSTIVHVKIDSK